MFETISNWVSVFNSMLFSFYAKDKPFYKFAEYLFIGVTAGYTIPLTWEMAFIPYVYRPLFYNINYITHSCLLVSFIYLPSIESSTGFHVIQ